MTIDMELTKTQAVDILKNEVSHTRAIKPVEMKSVDIKEIRMEYLRKDSDLIFHFFRLNETYWTWSFRDLIRVVFTDVFRMQERQDKLIVEWIEDLYSWYVKIVGIAKFTEPDDTLICKLIEGIDSLDV